MMIVKSICCGLLLCTVFACTEAQTPSKSQNPKTDNIKEMESINTERIVLGGGCFWCVEAVYTELKGVITVQSGYAGGKEKNPTYKEVAYGLTSHAEVVEVVFDADIISLEEILEVFFATHDPTTLNRQGNDVGPQYRSIILHENEQQQAIAEQVKTNFAASLWDDPIVTEIKPLTVFYEAEDYHQEYFANNPNQPYCRLVINPKVQKFRKQFADKLKQ